MFWTNYVGQVEICSVTDCYSPGYDIETSFIALNAETGWGTFGSVSGWYIDGVAENVYVETLQEMCSVAVDTGILVYVAIENPAGTGDLVAAIFDENDNELDSYGVGGGMPDSWPIEGPLPVGYPLTIPAGTTGKLRVVVSVVGFLATYDTVLMSDISVA